MPILRYATHAIAAVLFLSCVAQAQPVSRDRLIQELRNQDEWGDRYRRRSIHGATRLPFGTQIHPSCLTILARQTPGDVQAKVEEIQNHLDNVARMLTESCPRDWPELRTYTRRLIGHLRRAVITCTNQTREEAGYFTMAYTSHLFLPRDSAADLDDFGLFGSFAENHVPVVLLSVDALHAIVNPAVFIENSLIHELMHTIVGDNSSISDHNANERERSGRCLLPQDCELQDRVSSVATLCSNQNSGLSLGNIYENWASRGVESACINTFRETALINQIRGNDLRLSDEQSRSLCARLIPRARCAHLQASQYNAIAQNHPRLQPWQRRWRDRLRQVLPIAPSILPRGLLAQFPTLMLRWSRLQNSPCFRLAFRRSANGDWILSYPGAPRQWEQTQTQAWLERSRRIDQRYPTGEGHVYRERFRRRYSSGDALISASVENWHLHPPSLLSFLRDHPSHACSWGESSVPGEINQVLSQINQHVEALQGSWLFEAVHLRSQGVGEGTVAVRELFWHRRESRRIAQDAIATQVLGADLVRDYLSDLRTASPDSDGMGSCEALVGIDAGLSPIR